MAKVTVDMKMKMTPNVQTVTGSVEVAATDEIVMNAVAGTSWSIDLDPGDYRFVCAVGGQPGNIGPATVTVHAAGGDKDFSDTDVIDDGDKTGDIQIDFTV
jgi:hypothetical protein